MADSSKWRAAEALVPSPFQLDGDAVPSSRTTTRRSWIGSAEGKVARVESGAVWIGEDDPIALRHALPACVDLTSLLGKEVRATLVHVATFQGARGQTLTITREDGAPLLVAHAGEIRGMTHTLGKLAVYVALSQRPGGPMVFGTSRLQTLVRIGDHTRARDGEDAYVLHFQSRGVTDASYVIVREELWSGPPSTQASG